MTSLPVYVEDESERELLYRVQGIPAALKLDDTVNSQWHYMYVFDTNQVGADRGR